ncbi:hypothetical protein [Pengzhenrongella sp.]|uniref:hypothetical protein n=1 Tax=Pengzhenrongella sp. TaxID=2888820 RepID=UPI002F947811
MDSKTCPECGATTFWASTYNGMRRQFDATPVQNPRAPEQVRWYLSRARGAVPATIALRPATEPFLMLHFCRATRVGTGEKALSGFEIAKSTGPRVPDVVLDAQFSYSYRWVSNWAHIVRGLRTLCGARVLERLSEAELGRLAQMPVCPKCLARYPARLRRAE